MEVRGEHRFQASRAVTWAALLDPAAIEAATPGCESFVVKAPGVYDVVVKVGIAALKGTYRGTVTVEDARPEDSFRLVLNGDGQPGSFQGDATLDLEEASDGTRLRYRSEIRAQGGLARLGAPLLAGSAKILIGQFFKGMEREIAMRVP